MLRGWFVQAVCDSQKEGEDLVLATVLSKSGSAPCLAGAKMLVRSDGSAVGTVGGGVLEADTQARAAHVFATKRAEVMEFKLSGADAASMQMICGGNVRLLLDFVPATESNVAVFLELRDALQTGEKCYLVAGLGAEDAEQPTRLALILEDGSVIGDFPHPGEWRDALVEAAVRSSYPVQPVIEGQRFVVERCFVPSVAYICGSGHVGHEVALLAEKVDFQTVIIDDRPELASRERFPDAYALKVVDSFEDCFSGFDIDGDSYIVIVTRGHLYDKIVLEQALRTKAGYIGMMGSKAKRKQILSALLEEGFTEEDLARVHSPIGLSILASTPSEIAVSIVAELILTRAQAGA
jgi:xanthine dehydrogenase accessory factor